MDFNDIKKKIKTTKPQVKGDVVKKNGRGRPKKPGQKIVLIRMPEEIANELSSFCSKTSINKSAFVVQAIKYMMSDKNARNKLLVDKFL